MTADYRDRRVLVTGGLGFIGSTLTIALVTQGARVKVLDSLLPHFGGSPRNLGEVAARVGVLIEDTRDRDAVDRAVRDVDLVFHLAGASGPGVGALDFCTDLDIACLGTWHLLEAVRVHAPGARVVFASSRHVYAPDCPVPVAEDARLSPDALFGVHKLSGEHYVGVYRSAYGLDGVIARLTDVFGPRRRLQTAGDDPLARALEAALHDEDVTLYDGGLLVDYLYVDDAVDALLALGRLPQVSGLTVNVGAGRGVTAREAYEAVVSAVGRGRIREAPAAASAAPLGARGFVADVARLRALGIGAPRLSFEEALRATADWYLRGPA